MNPSLRPPLSSGSATGRLAPPPPAGGRGQAGGLQQQEEWRKHFPSSSPESKPESGLTSDFKSMNMDDI